MNIEPEICDACLIAGLAEDRIDPFLTPTWDAEPPALKSVLAFWPLF